MNVHEQFHFPKIDVITQQVEAGLVPDDNKGVKRVSCCTYIWHKYFSWLPCVESLSELCLKVYFKVIYDELSHFECKTSKAEVLNDSFRDLADVFSTFSIQALDPKSPLVPVADKIKACADLYLKKKLAAVEKELIEVSAPLIKQTEDCLGKLKLSYRGLETLQRRLQDCIAGPQVEPVKEEEQAYLKEKQELEHAIYSAFIGKRTTQEKVLQDKRIALYETCNKKRALYNAKHLILEQLIGNYYITNNRLLGVQSTLESLTKQIKEISTAHKSCSQTTLRNLGVEIEKHLKGCKELLSKLADWHKNATSHHSGLEDSIKELSSTKKSLESQFLDLIAAQQIKPTVATTALETLSSALPSTVNDLIFSYLNPFQIKTHLFNSFRILETRPVDIVDMYDIRGDYASAQVILVGCRSDVLHNANIFLSHLLSLPIHERDYVAISDVVWSGFMREGGIGSLIEKIAMLRTASEINLKDVIAWTQCVSNVFYSRKTGKWDNKHKYKMTQYFLGMEHPQFLWSRYKHMAALNAGVNAYANQDIRLRTLLDKVLNEDTAKIGGFHKQIAANVLEGFNTALKKANDLVVKDVLERLTDEVCEEPKKNYPCKKVFFFVEQHPMLDYLTECEKIAQKSGVSFAVFSAKMFGELD